MQRIGEVGGLDIDLVHGLRSIRSPEYRRLHGLDQDSREESHADWLARVHPDDRDQAQRTLFKALESDALSYDSEYRIIRPSDGAVRWIQARADIERDTSGKAVRLVGAHIDVTEQKRSTEALRESEARLAAAFQSVPVGIAVIDLTGRAILSNAEYRRFLPNGIIPSRDPANVARWRSWDEHGRPMEPQNWPSARALRGETVVPGQEMLFTDDSGHEIWTMVSTAPTFDSDGKVNGIVLVISDIDEAKRAQEALRESDERLRGVLDGMGEAFGVIGPDFTILEHNQEALRMDGRRIEEIVGRSHWDAFPGTEHSAVGRVLRKAMADRQPAVLEHQYAWEIGRALWLEMRVYPTADGALAVFWRDVTERKMAETALRDSEERYRALFESMDEAYAVVDVLKDEAGAWVDFRFVEVNPAFIEHMGMPYPVGKTATELLGSPNPRWTELYGRALDTGRPLRVEETEHTLGRIFDLNIFSLDRARNRVAVLFTNVTDRKRAEAALRESEEKYRSLFEKMDEGFALCELVRDDEGRGIDYRYIEINPALVAHTKFSPEELHGRKASEVFAKLDPWLIETYNRVIDEQRSVSTEHYFPHVDQWLRINVFPRGGDRFAAIFGDVTARYRAEEAMRESERRQAFLLHFTDAIRSEPTEPRLIERAVQMLAEELAADRAYATRHNPAADLTDVIHEVHRSDLAPLPARLRFSDFPEAGRQTFEQTLVFEDTANDQALTEADRIALASMRVGAFLSRPLRRNGSPIFALGVVSVVPRRWTSAEIALVEEATERTWVAAERVRAQAALRESEERLRLAIDVGQLATWDWDLRSGEVAWNERHFLMQGYKVEEVTPSFEAWIARVHPDDRAETVSLIERARQEHSIYSHEFRTLHPDGAVRWCSAQGVFFYTEKGEPIRMIGVMEDVTDRKMADQALRKSEERFRHFGDASQDVLWIRDAEKLQWTYLTPAFETIYGLSREEVLKGNNYRSWLDLVVPEAREFVTENIRRVRGGEHATFDYRIRRPSDGQIRWLRNTDFPITDQSGQVTLIGGIGHDLTELRETQLRLETLVQRIPQLVWRAVDGGDWTWASPQWVEFTGLSIADSAGSGWLEALHPDDRTRAESAWRHAVETGGFEVEYRLCHVGEQEYRWFQTRATPVRDGGGAIVEWLGTSTDIHDLRELQERQRVLVAELQHRTRNLMGVVSAMTERSLESSLDLDDFRARFRDRLSALARVQGLLSRLGATDRLAFDEVIDSELSAMTGANNITLDGPTGIRLRSSMVQTLAPALHELATNAVKYGALGQPNASLTVRWRIAPPDRRGRPRLLIEWIESGVAMPPVGSAPQGSGQGRELIEETLPYQLGAETRFEMTPDGVHCSINIPISQNEDG